MTKTTAINLVCVKLSFSVNFQQGIKWLLVFAAAAALTIAVDPTAGVYAATAAVATFAVWVWVWQVEIGKPTLETRSGRLVVSSSEESHRQSRHWCVGWHLGRIHEQPFCLPEWQA